MARRTIKIPQKGSKGTDMSQVEKANDIISSLESIQGKQKKLAPVKPTSIPKTKIVIAFAFFSIITLGILSLGNFPQTQPKGNTLSEGLNFEFQLLNGEMVNLSDFAGTPIVLDLMAINCPPCKIQVQELKSLQLNYPNVQIISVSVAPNDDSISRLVIYKDENDMTWIVGRDTTHKGIEVFSANYVPTMAFINSAGTLKHRYEGVVYYDTLVDWIKSG